MIRRGGAVDLEVLQINKIFIKIMNRFFFRSVLTAFIISSVVMLVGILDIYLEKIFEHNHKKLLIRYGIHFVIIFIVSMLFLTLFEFFFNYPN